MAESKLTNKKDSGAKQSGTSRRKSTGSSVSRTSMRTRKTRGKARPADAKTRSQKEPQGIPMKNEIQLVTSFGVMLILMLSNFGWCGTVGSWLASFFFGIFGCVQYVMPVAFFLMVTVLLANDYSLLAMKKCGAGFVVLMTISAYAQLIYQKDVREFYDLFAVAASDHRAGGIIGGGVGLLLQSWFGIPGAIIILSCLLLLALIMLTQRSFVGFFRNGLKKSRAFLKEMQERRKAIENEKITSDDMLRAKQCEEKLREMEEKKGDAEEPSAAGSGKTAGKKKKPDIRIHIPLFTPEDEVKKKDSLKELHPEIYPFTEEDGNPVEFDGSLDFSAFTLHGGGTQEMFSETQPENERAVRDLAENHFRQTESELPEEITFSGGRGTGVSGQSEAEDDDWTEPEVVTDNQAEPEAEGSSPVEPEVEPDTWAKAEGDSPMESEVGPDNRVEPGAEGSSPTGLEVEPDIWAEPEAEGSSPVGAEAETDNRVEPGAEGGSPVGVEAVTDNRAEPKPDAAVQKDPRTARGGRDQSTSIPAGSGAAGTANMTRKTAKKSDYIFPPMNLLMTEKQKLAPDFDKNLKETAEKLQSTLESFGVHVTITDISCGPTVTRYEMFPEQGTKVSKILSLTDDIKLNLAASDIRIEAPIPGKAAIGIEVPNKQNLTVHFRELVDSRIFRNFKSKLAFAVGKDIGGKTVVADLAKMPHLLIAGATGSGKSVCINTLIMSILYKARPSEVKLIMIDPKMVELSTYNGIPHLLIPVVTDPKKASGALNWAVHEMTDRYKKFTECSVRNIEGYNKKAKELIASGQVDADKMELMPQIVIIIDELADLMMVAPGEVEDAIVRLSQLARAAGIHLVIATQRPSVNVITGLIKANVPSRIAFSVSSGVDSRTIIDMNGAEKLLGKGDMLFYPSGYQKPVRVQGAFVSDSEVSRVVEFLKENEDIAVYDTAVSEKIENKIKNNSVSSERDEYFEAAARFIMEKDKATIGMLQRMFKIGFNRAARIIDQLADAGIVGPEEGTKPRKILMSPEQLETFLEENL